MEVELGRTNVELIEELARVFNEEEAARNLAANAGFPRGELPAFKSGRGFWTVVVDAIRGGKTAGGVSALGCAAAREFEHNEVFSTFVAASPPLVATRPRWGDHEREPVDPFPGLKAHRLDARELPQLVVVGERDGARVHWSYYSELDIQPFLKRSVAWDDALDGGDRALRDRDGEALSQLGIRLGRLLLGELGEDAYHTVARTVFRAAANERPTPFAGGVRCRLVLDASLEALPWRLAAVEDADRNPSWLTDLGWTFEHGTVGRRSRAVRLPNPCSIMFIVPEHGTLKRAGVELVERAKEKLAGMWSGERERLDNRVAVVHGRAEVKRELGSGRGPEVVVFFGHLKFEPRLRLNLKSGGSESKTVSFVEFVRELAAKEVKLLVLASTQAVVLPAEVRGLLPCVLLPTQAANARDTVLTLVSWLRTMLAEGLDPVRAMHRPPASAPLRRWCAMRAHTDFSRWDTAPAVAASVEENARLLIDRDEPRALFIRHIDALVKDERRRVEVLLAHGGEDDHLEWLGDQLWQEYEDRGPPWRLYRQEVPLAESAGRHASIDACFDEILAEALELEEGGTPEGAIKALATDRGWPRQPFVYWLDWHAQLEGIEVGVLEAWLRLAMRQLPQLVRGLEGIRVVSTLGVVPGNPDRFREVSGSLARDLQSDQTSITVFDPLGLVTPEHLMSYLWDLRITGCPDRLVRGVAEEIVRKTAGSFGQVVELVKAAERDKSWSDLARREYAPPSMPDLDRKEKI